jgi:hypothetical protein
MKPDGAAHSFYLKAVDAFGNYSSGYDSIALSQTVPVPVFVLIAGLFQKVRIEWEPINEEYYDVVEVWRNSSNSRAGATKIGEIHSNVFVDVSAAFLGTTYYYWIRTRSRFQTYSAWESGDTSGHAATTALIGGTDITDDSIAAIKLVSTIKPPVVWDGGSLPALPDAAYPEGIILYWTVDGKLYRNRQMGGGTSVSDDFNRANENPLSGGGNWLTPGAASGDAAIQSNVVYKAGSLYTSFALWRAAAFADAQYAQAKIGITPGAMLMGGPGVRCNSISSGIMNGYFFWAENGDAGVFCVSSSNGNSTDVSSSFPLSVASGDLLKIAASGYNFSLYKNGTCVGTRTDPNGFIASGRAGLYIVNSARIDDWAGADIGGGGSSGWTAETDGADLLAGSIVAGKIAAGAIGAEAVGTNELIAYEANLANAVIGTLKIGTDQVTVPSVVYNSGSYGCSSIMTNSEMTAITITAGGGKVLINYTAFQSGNSAGRNSTLYCYRITGAASAMVWGGGHAYSAGLGNIISAAFYDVSVTSGTSYTYKVYAAAPTGSDNTWNQYRTMSVLECKR